MKILYLVDGHVLRMGGAELQAFNLAKQLKSMGHDVNIVAPYLDRDSTQLTSRKGIEVRQLGYWKIPKLSNLFYMIRFAWFLRQEAHKYDAIHIHMVHKMAAVTGLLRQYTPYPVVAKVSGAYELYDGDPANSAHIGSLQYWLYKALTKLDYFQAISDDTCQRLAKAGIAREKILAIPNGVDTEKFAPSKTLHEGSPDGKIVICYCGRLVAVKGLETLIEAAAILQQQFPDQFEIHLNGDGTLRDTLQQQVQAHQLESVVLFKGRTDDVADALQKAHVYVQVSHYEGLSNAVLEAMSSGLPLVLSAAGGNPDVVTHGNNGLLIEPGNAAELAKGLSTLIESREICRSMGIRSRDRAVSEYSLTSVAARLLELYRGSYKNSAIDSSASSESENPML